MEERTLLSLRKELEKNLHAVRNRHLMIARTICVNKLLTCMVKINHNTLQVENPPKAERDSDDETIKLFFEESDEDDQSIENDYNDLCA